MVILLSEGFNCCDSRNYTMEQKVYSRQIGNALYNNGYSYSIAYWLAIYIGTHILLASIHTALSQQ